MDGHLGHRHAVVPSKVNKMKQKTYHNKSRVLIITILITNTHPNHLTNNEEIAHMIKYDLKLTNHFQNIFFCLKTKQTHTHTSTTLEEYIYRRLQTVLKSTLLY